LASILLLVRQGAAREVGNYMTRSAMGLDSLAGELEAYYRQSGTWDGASVLLAEQSTGPGMGRDRA